MTTFHNVYEDEQRARAYAGLDYPGAYYLAFRDMPQILRAHTVGHRVLDFGCGAGRRIELGLRTNRVAVDHPCFAEGIVCESE